MAIVRYYGKPDFFLTFTANPTWPEIVNELFEGQTATDRPELIARVFEQKKKALLIEIRAGILGSYI